MDFHEQLAKVAGEEPGTIDEDFKARSRRDPGTPSAAALAWATIFVLYALIVGGNMLAASAGSQEGEEEAATEWTQAQREAKFEDTRRGLVAAFTRMLVYSKDQLKMPESVFEGQIPKRSEDPSVQRSEDPMTRVQRVVMMGEFVSAERAIEELDALDRLLADQPVPDDGEVVIGEAMALEYLRQTYDGSLDETNLSAEMVDAKDYLGWWGKLARLHDARPDDPDRGEMIEAGRRLFVFVAVMLMGALLVGGAAIAAAVYMIVRLAGRRVTARFVPPAPGGSVYLEIFGVFLVGFVLVHVLGLLVTQASTPEAGVWATLLGQWSLIAVPLWPLVRGVPFSRMCHDLGLHKGEGVLREIGAGVVGYLAGLPILIGAYVFMIALQGLIQSLSPSPDPVQPNNPVMDLVQTQSVWLVAVTVSLAVIWAPLVEETVFRGALLRHMRGRVGILSGAILTGLLFAFLHPYGVLFTPPLIALGFTFAMLRQWRGSLIAPMTAHFLHNGTMLAVFIIAMNVVG